MIAWAAMAIVGALGAYARYRVAIAVPPRGTLIVNLSGAFVLGVVVGAGVSGAALLIVGTGFFGAYTTFSTWMVERTYLVTSAVVGFGLAWLGWVIGGVI